MKRFKAGKSVLCLLLCCTLLTGCWDKIEIEDRLFVLGIGLDKTEGQDEKATDDRLSMSYVSPILGEIKEGSGPAFKTYKTAGNTMSIAPVQLMERFSKIQFFGHTRVLLFGEELLKDEKLLKELIDAFQRTHEMHQSMYIYSIPGKAEDVFKVEPLFDRLLATYITGIADNSPYSARIMKQTLQDFLIDMNANEGSAIIPRLIPDKSEVKICGAGVIKHYKQIGNLSEKEGAIQNWLEGEAQGSYMPINYKGTDIVFRFFTFNRKIKLDRVENGKIYMTYSFETEGSIEEYVEGRTLLDDALLKDMEKVIEKFMEENSKALIKKYQEDFKVDLIGAEDYISKYHPQIYKQIQKDYEAYFTDNIVFETKATANIRRVGLSK